MFGIRLTFAWILRRGRTPGLIPTLDEMMPEIHRAGLHVTDIEVLRLHYAETLRHWRECFMARREEAARLYGEPFCRMWEFYLAASETGFRHDRMVVFQVQLARRIDAVPLTRDYIGQREQELRDREAAMQGRWASRRNRLRQSELIDKPRNGSARTRMPPKNAKLRLDREARTIWRYGQRQHGQRRCNRRTREALAPGPRQDCRRKVSCMSRRLFVVGPEPLNQQLLQDAASFDDIKIAELLGYDEAVRPPSEKISFDGLVETAEQRLDAYEGEVAGIIGYFDFPTSSVVPVLAKREGLPSPTLEAVAKCEHKYWARLHQRRVAPECVPPFCAVDPFGSDPIGAIDLNYPFWIKPIKAHSSYLGYKIEAPEDLEAALPVIRRKINTLGDAFNEFMSRVAAPPEVAGIGGLHCIAEEIISAGRQCTLEGYVWHGQVVVYGIVDSLRSGRHGSSFSRYQYPTILESAVTDRMTGVITDVMEEIAYDHGAFNAEFFWEEDTDALWLLEVNARISKSHCPLFKLVDGVSHHKVLVDLALDRKPQLPHREGNHSVAAKFMIRRSQDGIVRSVPHEEDLQRLREEFPDAMVRVLVSEEQRLAHLPFQDSYTFELAELFLGGRDEDDLLGKYERCLELLPFEIEAAGGENE